MSHRADEKQERRAERVRQEEVARREQSRQRMVRRSGYVAVGAIAATLVVLAVTLGGGGGSAPADHMAAGDGAGTAVVGKTAPDFALTDVVSNRLYGLDALKGRKTLLFFSEGVGCQACMVQAADLQHVKALQEHGIRVVSVSTDRPSDLSEAARQYGINTPLLADPTMSMSRAYGMLGHGGMGHPTQDGHAFMLLDAKGKVLWHQAYQEMYVKPSQLLSDMGGMA